MFKQQLKLPDAWSFDQDWVPVMSLNMGCVLLYITLKKNRREAFFFLNHGCFFIYIMPTMIYDSREAAELA